MNTTKVKFVFFALMTFYFTRLVGWNVFVSAIFWWFGIKAWNHFYNIHVVDHQPIFKED